MLNFRDILYIVIDFLDQQFCSNKNGFHFIIIYLSQKNTPYQKHGLLILPIIIIKRILEY